MDPWQSIKLLLLLISANGAPLVAYWLLGRRWEWPLDNHARFFDGRPLLGKTKTLRGILAAVAVTSVIATLLGMAWFEGALFALLVMLGDLFSSFIKRRLGFTSSHSVPLLDQIPESLLPAWMMQSALGLGVTEMLVAVAAFFLIDLSYSLLSEPPGDA